MSSSRNCSALTYIMCVDDIIVLYQENILHSPISWSFSRSMVPARGRLLVGRSRKFSLIIGLKVVCIRLAIFLAFSLVRPPFPIGAFLSFVGNHGELTCRAWLIVLKLRWLVGLVSYLHGRRVQLIRLVVQPFLIHSFICDIYIIARENSTI